MMIGQSHPPQDFGVGVPTSFRATGPLNPSLHIPASVSHETATPVWPPEASGTPAELESDILDEAGTLPKNCNVIIRGNQRTKSNLLGRRGRIRRCVGLGGWHLVVLSDTREEIRIQRNALVSRPSAQISVTLINFHLRMDAGLLECYAFLA